MEPERKIEKLLRAFAKKRRADAGEPMKLHPATRRLLQGEVARMPRPPEASSLSLWQLLRQEWSWLAGFALIIFFCAILFVPALNSAKHKAQSVSAMNNLKQVGQAIQMAAGNNNGRLPATLDELTNELDGSGALTDPQSGKAFVYVAGGETLDDLQTNSVLAYSPEDNNGRTVLFADGRVEMETPEAFAKETKNMPNQLALERKRDEHQVFEKRTAPAAQTVTGVAPAPEETPSTAAPAAVLQPIPANEQSDALAERETANATTANTPPVVTNGTRKPGAIGGFGGSGGGGFGGKAQLATSPAAAPPVAASPGQPSQVLAYRNKAPEASGAMDKKDQLPVDSRALQTPVLVNFQLQQNGNAIRVVDSDGSVYTGTLLATATGQNAPAQFQNGGSTFAARMADQASNNQNMQSSAGGIPFRVTGVNRSSQQNVVFEGNLSAIPGPEGNQQNGAVFGIAANANQSELNGKTQQQNQQQSVQMPNSRITGTATLGGTNQIEIDAVQITQ